MAVRKERNRVLREIGGAKNRAFRERMVGRTLSAVTLAETGIALTENYLKVELSGARVAGEIVDVTDRGRDGGGAAGGRLGDHRVDEKVLAQRRLRRKEKLKQLHDVRGFDFQVGEHAPVPWRSITSTKYIRCPFRVGESSRGWRGVVSGLRIEGHFGSLIILVLGGVAVAQADGFHSGGGVTRAEISSLRGGRRVADEGDATGSMQGIVLRARFGDGLLAFGLELVEVALEELRSSFQWRLKPTACAPKARFSL